MAMQGVCQKFKGWSSSKPPIKRLATQDQLSGMEIWFQDCIFVYKLKHIETQAYKYKRRKVAKYLGYSFHPLRNSLGETHDELFEKCIFNPSDRTIVTEHILNLETVKIKFSNCRFLRRDNKIQERLQRYWKSYQGEMIKFSLCPGQFDVRNEIIRLKDLPSVIEFMIEGTKNEDLQQ